MITETSTTVQIPQAYYAMLFQALAGNNVLLKTDAPRFTILAASNSYIEQTGSSIETMIGKGIFEAFPTSNNPGDTGTKDLLASLQNVLQTKKPQQLPVQRYDTAGENGQFRERYWKAVNKPVLGNDGEVAYIIHSAEEITDQIKTKAREVQIEGIEKAYNLLMQLPVLIFITKGKQHVLELVNEEARNIWGKTNDVIGKPIVQAIPEIEGQNILERFDEVMRNGQVFIEAEVPVYTYEQDRKERSFFDFFYKPYFDKSGTEPAGVLAISHDVTELVQARRKIEEKGEALKQSEQDLRTMVLKAPVGICVMDADSLVSEIANDAFLEFAGRPLNEVVGWRYWDTFTEARPY